MKKLGKILLRASLPPIIGLAICLGIIYFFPNLSDETYIVLMVVAFTLPQLLIIRD